MCVCVLGALPLARPGRQERGSVGLWGKGGSQERSRRRLALVLSHHCLSCLALNSMQELHGEMKVLASDLQDNNRIIEG